MHLPNLVGAYLALDLLVLRGHLVLLLNLLLDLLGVGGASLETRFKLKALYAISGSRVESMSLSS